MKSDTNSCSSVVPSNLTWRFLKTGTGPRLGRGVLVCRVGKKPEWVSCAGSFGPDPN